MLPSTIFSPGHLKTLGVKDAMARNEVCAGTLKMKLGLTFSKLTLFVKKT